jgi:hypothetical protein
MVPPEIDVSRWIRLCDELENLREHAATLSQRRFELSGRRNVAVRDA